LIKIQDLRLAALAKKNTLNWVLKVSMKAPFFVRKKE